MVTYGSPMADSRIPPATPPLNLFVVKEAAGWRVMLRPVGAPEYLLHSFDVHGEAFPMMLDWEDLARRMSNVGPEYETRPTRLGGIELTATGKAVTRLADWVLTAIASGTRQSSISGAADDDDSGPLVG
jgi:hypothetical protein